MRVIEVKTIDGDLQTIDGEVRNVRQAFKKPTLVEFEEVLATLDVDIVHKGGTMYRLYPSSTNIRTALSNHGYKNRSEIVSMLNKRLLKKGKIFAIRGRSYAYTAL